jgi:hypothetical protein
VSQALALMVITQSDSAPMRLVGCAALGFSVGNLISLPPMVIHREFEASAFTVLLGLSTAISGIVCTFGPGMAGLVRSLSAGYGAALVLVAALTVLWGRKQGSMFALSIARVERCAQPDPGLLDRTSCHQ